MIKILTSIALISSVFLNFRQDPGLEESKQKGKIIYDEFCITCHRADGTGFGKMYPPLAGSDFLKNNRKASIRGVKYGMAGEIMVNGIKYNKKMAPLGLTDEEVKDVMNYVMHSWGNQAESPVTIQEVLAIKQE